VFVPDDTSLADPAIDLIALSGYRQVTDLHLVNLAARHGLRLVTFDHKAAPYWRATPRSFIPWLEPPSRRPPPIAVAARCCAVRRVSSRRYLPSAKIFAERIDGDSPAETAVRQMLDDVAHGARTLLKLDLRERRRW